MTQRCWLPRVWHPVIRQRQSFNKQRLSIPGLWLKRRRHGKHRGDDRGTPRSYGE